MKKDEEREVPDPWESIEEVLVGFPRDSLGIVPKGTEGLYKLVFFWIFVFLIF